MKMNFTFHKKWRQIGWLAVFIFLFGTVSTQGQNLFVNPGFEDGMTKWSNWGGNEITTTLVRSGVNAITHTGNGGFAQTVTSGIEVGKAYTVSAWCWTPDGMDGKNTAIGVQFKGSDGTTILQISTDENIISTEDFQEFFLKFTVVEGTVKIVVFFYQEGGTTSLIADDFSLTMDVEEPEPVALLGTGFEYKPSFVNVTGGGAMPETTNGIVLVADGTGASDVTTIIQHFLDSAALENKALLIPYTDAYYKISNRLVVKGSVMGIGGMPKIIQTSSETNRQGLTLDNDMSGWIYNLHIVGTYDSTAAKPNTEYGHNIGIRAPKNVTIMNCVLQNALGDGIGTDGGTNGISYNILITNNNIINSYRNGIATTNRDDHWAIMNNRIEYYSSYVSAIDFEPHTEASQTINMEVGYNELISPKSRWRDADHFYDCVVKLAGWADSSPGENFFLHHNWGVWGVNDFYTTSAHEDGFVYWKNVESLNNIEGDTIPGPGAKLVTVPMELAYYPQSQSEFTLSWEASTADAGVKGYLVYQNNYLLGITRDTFYNVNGLSCELAYEMTVKAYDYEGNTSLSTSPLIALPIDCSGGLNMLLNPSFESLITEDWNLDWGGGFERIDTLSRTGAYSMVLGPLEGGFAQSLQGFKPDSSYTIQVYSKLFGMDEKTSIFGVDVRDLNGVRIYADSVFFPLDSLVWSKNYLTFTVPSNASSISIFSYKDGSNSQNLVFTDDWFVVPAVPVRSVALNLSSIVLAEGLVSNLKATITPENAINQELTWATSDSSLAVVTQNGFVKAMKAGNVVITVSTVEGAYTANCDISITEPKVNLIVNPGFENGFNSGWTRDWGGTQKLITDDIHSGKYAMSVGPGSGTRAQSSLFLLPGATYTLSAWGKLNGTQIDTTLGGIAVDFKNTSGGRMLYHTRCENY